MDKVCHILGPVVQEVGFDCEILKIVNCKFF